MAKITLMVDERNQEGKKLPVVIRVSHQQKTKYIPTGYKVTEEEWDEESAKVQKPFQNAGRANAEIGMKKAIAEKFVTDTPKNILKKLTVFQVVEKIERLIAIEENPELVELTEKRTSVFSFGAKVVQRLKKAKRDGYALYVEDCLERFRKYNDEKDLFFSDITINWLKEYEAYSQGKKMSVNSYGAYLRALRMLFNEAIRDKDTEVEASIYPFGKWGYSIKKAETKKRAMKESGIESIRKLELEEGSAIWHNRNIFLLIFNCRGINFMDLAYLERESLRDGRLIYKRKKTKKSFDIRMTDEANKIFKYYLKEKRAGNLVLPIIDDLIHLDSYTVRRKYMERLKTHNNYLKKIAKMLEIENLTSYVGRHTFATVAKRKGLSTSMIGDLLGHSDYKITETYLAEFESEEMDKAVEAVFN